MVSLLIHALELTLLGLLMYLGYRVASLFNSYLIAEGHEGVMPTPSIQFKSPNKPQDQQHNQQSRLAKVESIASCQIFTGIQLFELKRQGIDPQSPRQEWIDSGISYYLLGAASVITSHFGCNSSDKDDVMRYLLTKNLGYNLALTEEHISNLYHTDDQAVEKSAFNTGTEAANTWLDKKYIPEDLSLYNNLNNLGFVA